MHIFTRSYELTISRCFNLGNDFEFFVKTIFWFPCFGLIINTQIKTPPVKTSAGERSAQRFAFDHVGRQERRVLAVHDIGLVCLSLDDLPINGLDACDRLRVLGVDVVEENDLLDNGAFVEIRDCVNISLAVGKPESYF